MPISLKIQRIDPPDVQIEKHIRQQIQSGELEPGERLPTNAELGRMLGVSSRDVQRALSRLTTAGLISRAPRRGTFVRGTTEKATIGVLFGPSLSDTSADFYHGLHRALHDVVGKHHWTLRAYDGLSVGEARTEAQSVHAREHFLRDGRNYGFKGLIVVSPAPSWYPQLVAAGNLPLALCSVERGDVEFDWYAFGRDSARYAAQRGRSRLAFLRARWHSSKAADDLDGFLDAARESGLTSPHIEGIELIGQRGQEEREAFERTLKLVRDWKTTGSGPDALVVNDEIVMRGVAMALMQAGIEVPGRLLVISQRSEGVEMHYGLPVVRYEFPTREFARQLVELLWKRVRGEPLPALPIKIAGKPLE